MQKTGLKSAKTGFKHAKTTHRMVFSAKYKQKIQAYKRVNVSQRGIRAAESEEEH